MASNAKELEQARNSAAYRATKEQLSSRRWRMASLYWIKDKDGAEIPFRRKAAQSEYVKNSWFRDVIVKARQLGFSTEIGVELTDDLVFQKNITAAIVDYRLPDAKKKLEKIKFAYSKLPASIRDTVRMTKDNEDEAHFSNGSRITVGTSFRGDTCQRMHVSEYGKISTDDPKGATEIKTGAFQSVGMNGKLWVESTAHGIGGEFYDLVQRAEKKQLAQAELTQLDFKLHFYPWHIDPDYRLAPNLVSIPKETLDYVRELQDLHGIRLDAFQVAYYQNQLEIVGPDDIKSEYPSTMSECFFNSLEGAYFKLQLGAARRDKRIGFPVPYDPTRVVNTFSDIGVDDQNATWFHQSDGVRHRLIDYDESSGLTGFIKSIDDRQRKRGFVYGKHYGPHDLTTRDWTAPGLQTRKDVAAGFGVNFVVVPRVTHKIEAIESARRFIGLCWIDQEHCELGVKALDNYRKSWNDKLGIWGSEPVHDWASHGADGLMTGAMGWVPDGRTKSHINRPDGNRGSAWAS